MDAPVESTPSKFADRVLRFLERVEHRVATSSAEREAVFRLRYEAYLKNGLMKPRTDRRLFDKTFDDAPNAWITTTFIDGEFAGTTRVNLGTHESHVIPCLSVYPDVVATPLRSGNVIVEFTRLAVRLDFSRLHPELAYITMRPGYLAAEHFDADIAVASPRAEHMPFYRRVFRGEPLCEPRAYPGLTAKFLCMSANFRASKQLIEARYPFFRSTVQEREALFGSPPTTVRNRGRATLTESLGA
jgi:hypothetical protein